MSKGLQLIKFDDVSKQIKNNVIIKNVNFTVTKGEVVGIVGSNGSGKTTILKLASGLSYATKGEVSICGKKIEAGILGGLPTSVGILIESPKFLDMMSGFENLNFISKIAQKITQAEIVEVMNLVGLDSNDKRKVGEYSLGMRQRLGIAQAIMEKPDILLFDEPTNGLDKEGLEIFDSIIKRCKNRGAACLFVSHNKDEIKKYCDRVFKLENKTLLLQKEIISWNIVLNNLEDVEQVLILKPDSRIGNRYKGKPVVVVLFESKNDVIYFCNKHQLNYHLIEESL